MDTTAGPEAHDRLAWHTETCIRRLLEPTLASLSPAELRAVEYAALLPPDNVPLPWLRELLAADFPDRNGSAPSREGEAPAEPISPSREGEVPAEVLSWEARREPRPDVMKTWPCADFSVIRDLLILSWCKPVFAGIEPILPTSLGTSPRRP